MLDMERAEWILQALERTGAMTVQALAEAMHVSASTVRRDLARMEQDGLVRRTHGGVLRVDARGGELPWSVRSLSNAAEKNAIAQLAARLVRDDMHLLLDGTTTTAHLIKHLRTKKRLKIVTNSAQLALTCLEQLPARVCLTGGWLNANTLDTTSDTAHRQLADYACDLLFFSARSLSLARGVSDVMEEDVHFKRRMLKSARKAVFLCDHTKFDEESFCQVCELSALDALITDREPTEKWLAALRDAGVKVLYPGC